MNNNLEYKDGKLVLDDVGETVKDNNSIYYVFNSYWDVMPIYKYNLSNGSSEEVFAPYKDGVLTGGFDSINVTKDYIIACWDTSACDTVDSKRCIYRFNKDGSNPVQLAMGYSPIVVGEYIYYIQLKLCWNGLWDTEDAGCICRMRLDGSGKVIVATFPQNLITRIYRCGNTIVYSVYYGFGEPSVENSYKYYDMCRTEYSINNVVTKNSLVLKIILMMK